MLGFFWLYGAALVSYSYAMSTLFSSSRVAGTASQLLYALSMLPGFLMPAVRTCLMYVATLACVCWSQLDATSTIAVPRRPDHPGTPRATGGCGVHQGTCACMPAHGSGSTRVV